MNYIKQLETDKKELQDIIKSNNEVLHEILSYLTSSKFQGVDVGDGSLNNYVNTNDIIDRIRPILRPLNPENDPAVN